jgi:hypothetical protein
MIFNGILRHVIEVLIEVNTIIQFKSKDTVSFRDLDRR